VVAIYADPLFWTCDPVDSPANPSARAYAAADVAPELERTGKTGQEERRLKWG